MGFADAFINTGKFVQRATNLSGKKVTTVGEVLQKMAKEEPKGWLDDVMKSLERSPNQDTFVAQAAKSGQKSSGGGFSFNNAAAERRGAISRGADDVLENTDDVLPQVDDYWRNRESEIIDEYVDDVYKSIDDNLNSSSYSPFDNDPFGF